VTKVATVSLHGNTFEVDAALVGHRVEVIFDPFDLESVEIRFQGRSMGAGVPHKISRHSHPKAPVEGAAPPAPVTGIDYLGLVAARHEADLARHINYSQLSLPEPDSGPGDHGNSGEEVGA
jgi:putative transposase